ncbi:hypothetical protein BDV96DRAFT_591064 [Lophiotrema nucula]|uniref:FAD/NAD(P)-binding domain-containing protein n=1 Tax=Lophiotrema nucula TaxID=690887 RepID=A0A6A5YJN0_9PLEO|nr:hypothetical protein BDV96DRAFT_591064 [Lophiotrema nucula]
MAVVDTLIIGAGPAGLSAALSLARQLHTAVVFSSGVFRNEISKHMHTVGTWDHRDPADFRGAFRKEILERYSSISFVDQTIARVEKRPDTGLFVATASNGQSWSGRRMLLATGVRDLPPDIKGYSECWGVRIYHCLFCHGYEDRGASSAGILAIGELAAPGGAVALARSARQMTEKVTIYTNGATELTESILLMIKESPSIQVDSRPIEALALGAGEQSVDISFTTGDSVNEAFLVHKPKCEMSGPFARQLGLELTSAGDIKASPPFQATSVKGVYAAGDVATPAKAVIPAMSTGTFAGIGIAHDLQGTPGYKI